MTVRTVLRKHEDGKIEVVGDYEGASARAAGTAAMNDEKTKLKEAAFNGEKVELAAPPAKALVFEERGLKIS